MYRNGAGAVVQCFDDVTFDEIDGLRETTGDDDVARCDADSVLRELGDEPHHTEGGMPRRVSTDAVPDSVAVAAQFDSDGVNGRDRYRCANADECCRRPIGRARPAQW